MLDKNLLREQHEQVKESLGKRSGAFALLLDEFLQGDVKRRQLQTELDAARAQRNEISGRIGALMKAGQREEGEALKGEAQAINARIAEIEAEFEPLDAAEQATLLAIPNLPADDVPAGGEEANVQLSQWGTPLRTDIALFDHVELCQRLQLVNFEAGARVAGSGFPVMWGQGAQLQRALISFMLDLHIGRHGYTEVRPPFIVHPRAPLGTGNLPKFADDMYWVTDHGRAGEAGRAGTPAGPDDALQEAGKCAGPTLPDFFLIPTAEVPVANLYREQILDAPALPLKFCAYSPCFRVEGGSYGKDARGLTRLHQFEKVELVCVADPDASWDVHEQMIREAETVLEMLELPYRRILLAAGDIAFASAKTMDLEVYCPAGGEWREVSSISNTTDYQARRMNLRVRREAGAKPVFPHILNASGLALPRLMIALLETYQTAAGTIRVPDVLRDYLRGIEELAPPEVGPPFV